VKTLILALVLTILAGCVVPQDYHSSPAVGIDYDAYNAYIVQQQFMQRRKAEQRQKAMQRQLNDLWLKSLNQ